MPMNIPSAPIMIYIRRVEAVRDHKNNLIAHTERGFIRDGETHNQSDVFDALLEASAPQVNIHQSVNFSVSFRRQSSFNQCLVEAQRYNQRWDFGDGTQIRYQNRSITPQSHAYRQAGTYVTTLYVEVTQGYWAEFRTAVQVIDVSSGGGDDDTTTPLKAHINGQNPQNNSCFEFISTVSGGERPYRYQWIAGDGTIDAQANGPTYDYCYQNGNYTARLIVTDATGATTEATYDVVVAPMRITLTGKHTHCAGHCATYQANVYGGIGQITFEWEVVYQGRVLATYQTQDISFSIPRHAPDGTSYVVKVKATDSQTTVANKEQEVSIIANCPVELPSLLEPHDYVFYRENAPIGLLVQEEIRLHDQIRMLFTNHVRTQRDRSKRFVIKVRRNGVDIRSEIQHSAPTISQLFDQAGSYQIVLFEESKVGNQWTNQELLDQIQIDICEMINW